MQDTIPIRALSEAIPYTGSGRGGGVMLRLGTVKHSIGSIGSMTKYFPSLKTLIFDPDVHFLSLNNCRADFD